MKEESFVYWRYRPYFDLGPVECGSLCAHYPLLGYEALMGSIRVIGQRQLRETFRISLLQESGLDGYATHHPNELRAELRTPKWQHLCDLVDEFDELDLHLRARVARLLIVLGFHRLVLELIPRDAVDRIVDDETAIVAVIRVFAKQCLRMGLCRDYDGSEMAAIVERAPRASRARYSAANWLMVSEAKFKHDAVTTRRYREIASEYLASSSHDHDSFDYRFLQSQFYRGASYAPYLEGDLAVAREELELCEQWSRSIPASTDDERLLARDDLFVALESQMRLALEERDVERAIALIEEAVSLDPWDPKARLEHGEVLLKAGRVAEALRAYRLATYLSPPATALANYLAGYCCELLDDPEEAVDHYLRALEVDPDGISAVAGLMRVARRLANAPILRWAEANAERLVGAGKASPGDFAETRPASGPRKAERAGR
jgi:tetratricopeptide (TPR) repeat protein